MCDDRTKEIENLTSGELKSRLEMFELKLSLAQDKFDKKIADISRLEEDILKIDGELIDCKSKTAAINERWKIADLSIDKFKWMGEKARIVLESNCKMNELHSKTMETIERNHLDLTARAFKTVRQEAAGAMINAEINNLTDNKKELRNKLFSLRKIKAKNEKDLATASMELIGIKARAGAVLKLRNKLQESEALRLSAMKRLRDLKAKKTVE